MRGRGAGLLAALVGAALLASLGSWLVLRRPDVYRSQALLLIDNPAGLATAGDDGLVNKLNSLRGKYETLGATSTVLAPAAERLGVSAGELGAGTKVRALPASLLLAAIATSGDAERSRAYAQVVAEQLVTYVKQEMERSGVAPERRISLTVIDPAPAGDRIAPSFRRAGLVAGVLGLVGLVAGWVLGLRSTPLRRAGSLTAAVPVPAEH